jgi:hypothetical protein
MSISIRHLEAVFLPCQLQQFPFITHARTAHVIARACLGSCLSLQIPVVDNVIDHLLKLFIVQWFHTFIVPANAQII